ncbi:unnamed protein product [Enterobius vermicularis]|uniref:Uncharacterized protein n=1 Tax=Enterobius vermicularis TaxID=51028 RepID=A0A0N4V489_ENTVE|nr:unnamed protein product [Enterobius vermicularis]
MHSCSCSMEGRILAGGELDVLPLITYILKKGEVASTDDNHIITTLGNAAGYKGKKSRRGAVFNTGIHDSLLKMHSYGLDTSIKFNNTTNKNKTINQPFDSNNPKLQYLHEKADVPSYSRKCEQHSLLIKPKLEVPEKNQQVPAEMPAEIPVEPEEPINEPSQDRREIHW